MIEILVSALSVVGKVMDKLPDYEQKKAEQFHKLRGEYETELKKPLGLRNDQLVLDLSDELRRHVEDFAAVLSAPSVESV